jgi:phage recombination protein Bet
MPSEKKTNGSGEEPFLTDEKKKILRETLLQEYNEKDVMMFLTVAETTKLDPFTRQLHARPENKNKRGKDGKYERMILITAYTGFLTVADRSGVYDGCDPWMWCDKQGNWVDVWIGEEPPYAAKVSVWRKDHTRPETAISYWKARVQTYWDSDAKKRVTTDMWANDGPFMLGKCALAAALRRLFPNLLTQVYEESEFKSLEHEETTTLEADIKAQEERIKQEAAAAERLKTQGVSTVPPSGPAFPARDPRAEVEPVKGLEPKEPDDLDMGNGDMPGRDRDWWKRLPCDVINRHYAGKLVSELSPNLLEQAVEKWVPRVRAKWNETTQQCRDLAEALELGLQEMQRMQGQAQAAQAARSAEGAQ